MIAALAATTPPSPKWMQRYRKVNPGMASKKNNSFVELLKTIFYAVGIAILVRTFAFEPFSIPSGSMIPTLLIGDYLFVSKYSYGYSRYSLPLGIPLIPGRIFGSAPERGDVVVFKLPTDNKTDYIKRIIGLPGDRIQVIHGIVNINDVPVKREPAGEYETTGAFGNVQHYRRYVETLPNGRSHYIIEITDDAPNDNTQVYTVPEGHYFAMGDNRDSSRDSRYLGEVGYIPSINLIGRAEIIFLSFDGSPLAFWQWPDTLRTDRILQIIR